MANTVKIELNVDSAGAVSGTREIDAAMKSTSASVKQLGATMEATGTKTAAATAEMGAATKRAEEAREREIAAIAAFNRVAAQSTAVNRRMLAAQEAASAAGKNFAESLEAAVAAEVGYTAATKTVTRATHSMGAGFGQASILSGALRGNVESMGYGLSYAAMQSKALGPLLEAAMPVMLAAGFVGILADMAMQFAKFVEEAERAPAAIRNAWAKLNTASDATSDSLAIVNDKLEEQIAKLEGTHPNHLKTELDEAKLAADKLATSLENAQSQMDALLTKNHIGGLSGFISGQAITSTAEGSIRYFNQKIADLAVVKQTAMNRGDTKGATAAQKQIRDAQDAALRWVNQQLKIGAWRQKLNKYTLGASGNYSGVISEVSAFGHRIENEESLADLTARNLADRTRLGNDQDHAKPKVKAASGAAERAREIARIHEQALESSLHGEALYEQKMKFALDELAAKDIKNAKTVADVHEIYDNQHVARLQAMQEATARMGREAALVGLTGLARVQQEGLNRVADINDEKDVTPEEREKRIAYAQKETNAEMLREQQSFTDEVNQLADRSADHQLRGFARIEAERRRQLQSLQADFDKEVNGLDLSKPGAQAKYNQMVKALGHGNDAINENAANARSDLAKRNAEETAAIEAQANSRSMRAMHNQTAAIEAEYKARTTKYHDELMNREISEDDFNRRVAAAAKIRNAEVVEASRRAHDRMAREFTSFFHGMNHPLQELARLGNRAAGNEAANLWQRFTGAGTITEPAGKHNMSGALFGTFHKKYGNRDAAHELAAGHVAATSSVFSVSTAVIHVGSGSIAFGGAAVSRPSSHVSFANVGHPDLAHASITGGTASGVGATIASLPRSSTASVAGGFGSVAEGQSIVGNLGSGLDLYKQASTTFGNKLPLPKGLKGFVGTHGTEIAGGATGALGLFSAYESNGGAGGALGGAMSGMQLGMMVGGPIGAGIGAAAGAIMGAFGFGGREKARVYDLKQVRPRIKADTDSYEQGSMDYTSAYSDMQSLMNEAKHTVTKMGPSAGSYYQGTIKKEIETAEQRFSRMEKAGRRMYAVSSASYAVGTDYVPSTGMALLHEGERIVPASENRQIARALYRTAMQSSAQRQMRFSGGETHIHLSAIDARSSHRWLMENKNALRSAVNASYAENSGGSDF